MKKFLFSALFFLIGTVSSFASEADLKIPDLNPNQNSMLTLGLLICVLGLGFGIFQFWKVKKLKAHKSMLDVAEIIYATCKTYLQQQGKFLAILFVFIAACMSFYFGFLQHTDVVVRITKCHNLVFHLFKSFGHFPFLIFLTQVIIFNHAILGNIQVVAE